MTFPNDRYTPFGYLANPYHQARDWEHLDGGLLRTTDDALGLGWLEPTARTVEREAAILIVLRWNGRLYQTRADFGRLGYWSAHHSAALFSYDWEMDQVRGCLRFALAEHDVLVAELSFENRGVLAHDLEVWLLARVDGEKAIWEARSADGTWMLRDRKSPREVSFAVKGAGLTMASATEVAKVAPRTLAHGQVAWGFRSEPRLGPGATLGYTAGLVRGAAEAARRAAAGARSVLDEKRAADDRFYATAARPVGDWPSAWKRGWVYDLETTRACVFPAGGIFQDVWPSWMITWPRVVLAEGTLDAVRLSYAAPELALRLTRTLLCDAPGPNVPCVFVGGEPNMVAKDGTVCGTSPAWCLPFYNLWLLYCRTVDRSWLADVYPRLVSYLEYWLTERTDPEGWCVYKCTWEAGEDCTPRLDPSGAGDEVISRYVRPVELQATMSQSAAILARFAHELGRADDETRWRTIAADYALRTQELWDPVAGRFRDWDKRSGQFLGGAESQSYWQTDPVRYSALSLTPLVAGLATAEQCARLASEIAFYDAPPWCLWPSWSYVVAEAATTAGWHDFAGKFAARIIGRVYEQNDRRSLEVSPRPTPGTAPEFWPIDLADFNGSDGYGWGATTSSLWVRQVFGFLDGQDPSVLSFGLAPNLPIEWLTPRRRYGFVGLPYRGLKIDITYEVGDTLMAEVKADRPVRIRVSDLAGGGIPVEVEGTGGRFEVANGGGYCVKLQDD